jgi:hypothetical protein
MNDPIHNQVAVMVAENRRLLKKSAADDATIHILKEQYDTLQAGVENMVEDHRRIERELSAERDRAVRAFTEIDGLLNQTADLVMQAARARTGDNTPEQMPERRLASINDDRLPIARLSS